MDKSQFVELAIAAYPTDAKFVKPSQLAQIAEGVQRGRSFEETFRQSDGGASFDILHVLQTLYYAAATAKLVLEINELLNKQLDRLPTTSELQAEAAKSGKTDPTVTAKVCKALEATQHS